MKKKTFENLKRALVLVLCAVMIGNVVQLPTVTVHAETEGTSEGGETSGGTNTASGSTLGGNVTSGENETSGVTPGVIDGEETETASGSALTISDEETTATPLTIVGHVPDTDDSEFFSSNPYAAFALMTAASGEEGEAGDSGAQLPVLHGMRYMVAANFLASGVMEPQTLLACFPMAQAFLMLRKAVPVFIIPS